MDSPDEVRLNYAWGWFSHHASQRFTSFNFFIVAVGALTVAYANAASHHSRTLGMSVAVLGVVMSVAFTALDIRNGQLVGCARRELEEVEPRFDLSITRESRRTRRHRTSHSTWLRTMTVGFGLASAAAVAWSLAGSSLGY